jgi:hypothetical protein
MRVETPGQAPLLAGSQSHPGRKGKMGEYSVFDMIGRKRPDPYKWSENQNCLPATGTTPPPALYLV